MELWVDESEWDSPKIEPRLNVGERKTSFILLGMFQEYVQDFR